MAISKDLFLAILAMDAYNRGYNPGVSLAASPAAQIGLATIGVDSKILDQTANEGRAQAASFFAQAYTLNGETIISYRGTDNLPVDALTGYGTGRELGMIAPQGLTSNAVMPALGAGIHDFSYEN